MNRYDKFFSELTLVSFTGGAMGSFLINFLMAADEEYYQILKNRTAFGLKHNHEWQLTHYFQDIRDLDASELTLLSNYYGKSTYIQQTLYAVAQIVQDLFLSRQLVAENIHKTFSFEKVLKLVKRDFDKILFPYVKNHQIKSISTFDCNNKSLNFKKKIYCFFPANKNWIIPTFSLYKHNLYKLFHDNHDYNYGLGDVNYWMTLYHQNDRIVSYSESIPGHESLDMYELVFNKNFDGLRKIYPGYQPNDLQLTLLDQAYDTSMIVLDNLKLSHEMKVDEFKTKDFFDETRLIELLTASLELEKKK